MTVQTRTVRYRHGDVQLEGFLAWDDRNALPRPAVLVSHTWTGRDDFACNKARRLAELGYAGFALDMYGGARRGASPEENAALMAPLMEDRALLQGRILSALDAVRQQPETDSDHVAAIGFCFGGLCVLDLARSGAALNGIVSFHGLLTPPPVTAAFPRIAARILVLHGYDDPMAPPEQVLALADELTAAGADWQIHAYGGTVHAFTNPIANNPAMGTVYREIADRRSWQSMTNFLTEVLN
jgi:dienelactone hydrolase